MKRIGVHLSIALILGLGVLFNLQTLSQLQKKKIQPDSIHLISSSATDQPPPAGSDPVASLSPVPLASPLAAAEVTPPSEEEFTRTARKLIEEAQSELGVTDLAQLGAPVVQRGLVSTQVFFRQQYQGLPLRPRGLLTVDLGPQGEKVGIYADWVSQWSFVSGKSQSMDQIRAHLGIPQSYAGVLVVWIDEHSGSSSPKGRLAYEFFGGGRTWIVDAEEGRIYLSRDRRHRTR